ncbi:MAG: hypothetical protein PSX81_14910 [bacterium]|nr:hypothetical protein [bacterium]
MKKLFVIAIAAFAFTACNNSAKPEETTATDSAATSEVAPVAPEAAPVAVDTMAAPATTPEAAPAK